MEVGFVGLGDQGGPMADAILAGGHRLHLWARRPEVLARFVAAGAVAHSDVAAMAEVIDFLGLCVTSEQDVRQLLYDRGVLAAMRPGSVICVHATIAPEACRELATEAAAGAVVLLDAPVSGGREAAVARRLLVIVGGPATAVAAARPVFACYADRIRHVGEAGSAQTVKLLNNLLLNANLAASHFILEFGKMLGLERTALRDALLDGTGASVALDWLDRTIIPGSHPAKLGEKDIALALALRAEPPEAIAKLAAIALAGRSSLAGLA